MNPLFDFIGMTLTACQAYISYHRLYALAKVRGVSEDRAIGLALVGAGALALITANVLLALFKAVGVI